MSPAVCALLGALLVGATGCGSGGSGGSGDARGGGGVRPSPVGKVLEDTDEEGRHYREVDGRSAPEIAIEVQPDTDEDGDGGGGGGWDVRLTVRGFRFSPAGTDRKAEPGRGYALLRLDDRPLSVLRGPAHHLRGDAVPRGTHRVTVRLHADDDTVWAVDGRPVAGTADITVSGAAPTRPDGERPTTGRPRPASPADGLPSPAGGRPYAESDADAGGTRPATTDAGTGTGG